VWPTTASRWRWPPVLEHHAARAALLDRDLAHRRGEPQLRARIARRGRDRLGEPPHAALDVRPDAARAVRLAHHVVEEHVAGAGRRRRRPRADQRVGRERAAQRLALEPRLENEPRGAEQQRGGLRKLAAQAPDRAREVAERREVPRARAAQVGRRAVEQRLERTGHAVEERLVGAVALGVAHREARDRLARALGVGAEQQPAAARQRRERRGVARDQPQPAGLEAELAHERRAQQARHVGRARDPVAGPELLGRAGAARQLAALEHHGAQARPRQVGGGREPVVPRPDHGDVAAHRAAV
jgi:hypothetical protein